MQESNGKLVPIQWASEKLTETKQRYGISDKQVLAVYGAMKKIEDDLRGRENHIVTDHKALNLRTKPSYKIYIINRWIRKIQDFDITIEYQKYENL